MNEICSIKDAKIESNEKIPSWTTTEPISIDFEITDKNTINLVNELLKEARQRELERICHNYYYMYIKRW